MSRHGSVGRGDGEKTSGTWLDSCQRDRSRNSLLWDAAPLRNIHSRRRASHEPDAIVLPRVEQTTRFDCHHFGGHLIGGNCIGSRSGSQTHDG